MRLSSSVAIGVDERLVQLVGEAGEEACQRRALGPLDHVGARRQHVRVHLEPHVLFGEAELEQQLGVLLRAQHVDVDRIGGGSPPIADRNGSVWATATLD